MHIHVQYMCREGKDWMSYIGTDQSFDGCNDVYNYMQPEYNIHILYTVGYYLKLSVLTG